MERAHEKKKAAEGGDLEGKSINGEIKGIDEQSEPKGKGKNSDEPPNPTGPRKK